MKGRATLDDIRPSSFSLEGDGVIHSKCGVPMALWQRDLSGEERWFCLACRESVYIPREAWLFFVDQLERDETSMSSSS